MRMVSRFHFSGRFKANTNGFRFPGAWMNMNDIHPFRHMAMPGRRVNHQIAD